MRDVTNVLGSLRNVVKDKLGDLDSEVEIKLFPGLSVTSKCIPLESTKYNLSKNTIINTDHLLHVGGRFSNRFKKEIKNKN